VNKLNNVNINYLKILKALWVAKNTLVGQMWPTCLRPLIQHKETRQNKIAHHSSASWLNWLITAC